jgi:hypothetical protein
MAACRRRSVPALLRFGLLALFATGVSANLETARAAGLSLTWGSCGQLKVANRTFACNTDAGADTLSVSFTPTFSLTKVAFAEVSMSVCFNQVASLPWWQVFDAGTCRGGALTMAGPSPAGACNSIWDPAANLVQHIEPLEGGGLTTLSGARFTPMVTLADSALARDMVAGQEYELFRLVLHHTHTTGSSACAGCQIGARLAADFIWVFTTTGDGQGMSTGSSATWQVPTTVCEAVVPVQRSTWGALKSLYR